MPTLPSLKSDITNFSVTANSGRTTFDLLSYFDDPFTTGLVATFQLYNPAFGNGGTTNVVLFDQPGAGAPISVQNFLNYANGGDYTNSFIHRSDPGFVIQGGGFVANGFPTVPVGNVPLDPPIPLEYGANRPNTRGTIAFARQTAPNTATSQWFFNLANNTNSLGPINGGGFAVFGEVLSAADLLPIDAIAALPIVDARNGSLTSPFGELPVNADAPLPANFSFTSDSNLVRYQSITVSQRPELTFSVTANSNPNLVTPSFVNNQLQLSYQPGQTGSATLTLRATTLQGNFIEDSFSVEVLGSSAATPASLVWNTVSSVVSAFRIDGTSLSASTSPIGRTIEDTNWRLQTTGDLNGDGQDDVLLRNVIAGQNLAWYMQQGGDRIASEALIGRDVPDPNWSLSGTGDFDGDGQVDVLLRNEQADQIVVWYMNTNGTIKSERLVGRGFGDNNWKIEATADFNNDGQTDIVLRNALAGQNLLWLMNGSAIVREALIGRNVPGLEWQIEGAGDYNGDGNIDLFWRQTVAGQGLLWTMASPTQIAQEQLISNVPNGVSQVVF